MRSLLIYILTLLTVLSCTEDNYEDVEPVLVVEGWIDAGGFPKVSLTRNLPLSDKSHDIDNLGEYVIRWAKVTVSDGERSVVLTGKYTPGNFPPYIYTTGEMRGEEGKTYYLTVEYESFYATAQTTIPQKVAVKGFESGTEDGVYGIKALVDDNPDEKNYYKFFIKVLERDSMYLSSNFAVIDDKDYTFPCTIPVTIGRSRIFDTYDSHIMTEKDCVMVKFAQIDSFAYSFWDKYKNIVELGQNPFFRYSSTLPTNITGGIGYWFGYGASEYLFEPYNHANPVTLK